MHSPHGLGAEAGRTGEEKCKREEAETQKIHKEGEAKARREAKEKEKKEKKEKEKEKKRLEAVAKTAEEKKKEEEEMRKLAEEAEMQRALEASKKADEDVAMARARDKVERAKTLGSLSIPLPEVARQRTPSIETPTNRTASSTVDHVGSQIKSFAAKGLSSIFG